MDNLQEYLPFLIPIVLIHVILVVFSLIHIFKHNSYHFGNRAIWIAICLIFSIIGPALYLTIGKEDDK